MEIATRHLWLNNTCVKCGVKRVSRGVKRQITRRGTSQKWYRNVEEWHYYSLRTPETRQRPQCNGRPVGGLRKAASHERIKNAEVERLGEKSKEKFPFNEEDIARFCEYQKNLINTLAYESPTQTNKTKMLCEITFTERFLKKLGDEWVKEVLLFNPFLPG